MLYIFVCVFYTLPKGMIHLNGYVSPGLKIKIFFSDKLTFRWHSILDIYIYQSFNGAVLLNIIM